MNKFLSTLIAVALSTALVTTDSYADSITDYVKDVPGIGLISDIVKFDGIEISNFTFAENNKYIFVHPEEEFVADMDYAINSELLTSLHLHHFIIGLADDGPQACIIHSLGLGDKSGHATVTLKAPKKSGVYQVRFCHTETLTDQQAFNAWWRGDGPSAKTIVGIVVVK
ncbi:MAG: hypothetical protein Q8K75_08325 [Chlamydiales bacterium]|nr:hypothetical protein [Chlamydiales bacterium]